MSTRRVAVFGFYGIGNFGDDLMAWMIASWLRSRGHAVTILSLADDEDDSLHSIDFTRGALVSSRSIDHAIDSCDAVVYGGGGILVGHSERALRRFRRQFAKERQFLDAAAARRLPLMVMSVGGDGGTDPGRLDAFPRRLLSQAARITVRNPEDVALLRNLGVAGVHVPDLVWGARDMIAAPPRSGTGPRIGLDLYPSLVKRPGGVGFLAFLQAWMLRHRSATFVCLHSRHVSSGFDPGLGHILCGPNVRRYRFRDFHSDAAELSSLDLLISSRLHVPMLALQYGVPVISIFAEPKTRLMLEHNGLAFATFTPGTLPDLRSLLWERNALDDWIDDYRMPANAVSVEAWRLHFHHLDTFLHEVTPT